MMVTTLSRLKQQVRWPYPRLCDSVGLPYASFRRWKHRLEQGQPAFFRPGPRKVVPLNLEELRAAFAEQARALALPCATCSTAASAAGESARCIGSTKPKSPVAIYRR